MTAPRQGACATRHPRRTAGLSPTQKAIAACLIDAMTNMEIADAVGICSEKSVASHLERMWDKMQARNRTHLALIIDREMRTDDAIRHDAVVDSQEECLLKNEAPSDSYKRDSRA